MTMSSSRLVRRSGHGRRAGVVVAVAVLLTCAGGCDWEIEKEKVKQDCEQAIRDWFNRGMAICNAIQDPAERTKCLLKMQEDNTTLTKELIKLLASQVNCDEEKWKSAADVVKAILDALAKAVPSMVGLLAGQNGQVNVNGAAQQQGDELVFLPGSSLGVAYDGGDMVFQEVHGSLAMSLGPDGQGGFVGQVDAFSVDLVFFGEPMTFALSPDAMPSLVIVDEFGRGLMRMHLEADEPLLPKEVVYLELPIQTQPPFQFVVFSTGGDVPAEVISPRFVPEPGDCNSNGVDDLEDIVNGTSGDCDADGVPDECELAAADCNGNGVPDSCDIGAGLLHDDNGNGFADECEPEVCYPDFTLDGVLDLFDFLSYVNSFNAGNHMADCDANGVFDLFDFLCFVNAFNAGC